MIRVLCVVALMLAGTSAFAQTHDHSKMDHSKMDHSKMDHSKMDHSKMDHSAEPVTPIPEITDADRRAAFPDLHHHAHQHGTRVTGKTILDRLEHVRSQGNGSLAWEGEAWIGGDIQKLKLRSEGHVDHGGKASSHSELLYSRGIRAWWDLSAGIRVDTVPGGSDRHWVAVGVEGLAPYKIETSVTAYLGRAGARALKLGAEYDTLLTNRAIIQWKAETEFSNAHGNSNRPSSTVGARLRYEVTRQFAPYLGVERTWNVRDAAGVPINETRSVAGIRFWF